MTSKGITERKPDASPPYQWQTQAELSPSLTQDTEPLWSRVVGILGLLLVVVGGTVMVAHKAGANVLIPSWGGALLFILGLGGLLFHAASDADGQVRRLYMLIGGLALLLGAAFTIWDIRLLWGTEVGRVAYFLPFGLFFLVLGLLFLMGFLRNQTEEVLHQRVTWAIGAVGAVLAGTGFLFGTVSEKFLFNFESFQQSYGLPLILIGMMYLWAFLKFQKITTDLGHRAALIMGAVGLLVFLVAGTRSIFQPLMASRGWISVSASSYFMPSGLLLLGAGFAYVALAAGFLSENSFVVMTRRELGAFFCSPIAYFMLLLITLVAFVWFLFFVQTLVQSTRPIPVTIVGSIYIFQLLPVFCLVVLVPFLTMHLLSEENRNGTLEMILTAPQDETTLVLSKFTAALFMFLLLWLPWLLFLVALGIEGSGTRPDFQTYPDYQPILAWCIVLLFSGAGMVSMGLFFSSLTRNQLTAAFLTFVAMLLLVACFLAAGLVRMILGPGSLWEMVLTRISFLNVWEDSLVGRLGVTDLIFHLSVTVFWLFLTIKVLESRKWR